MHKELAKKGVTLTLLWSEYAAKCATEGSVLYQYSQFSEKYRAWAQKTKATMRISRKPGDFMEVDLAGQMMPVYDSVAGQAVEARECIFFCVNALLIA